MAGPVIQAPLRQAVGLDGRTMLIQVPFNSFDLENWRKVAEEYRADPMNVTEYYRFLIREHNPDWNDIQVLLEALTESERQLVI